MPDPRFFRSLPPLTAGEVAARLGIEPPSDGARRLTGVAPLSSAGPEDLAFAADKKFGDALAATRAGAVIVHPSLVERTPADVAVLVSRQAQADWARATGWLIEPRGLDDQEPRETACEDDSVALEPGVVLGRGVRIGRNSRIGANTVIGPGVQIGRGCSVGPNVSIAFALIGDRVSLYAGVRIGQAGFGAAGSRDGAVDVPQLGRVIIQDGVTVGANTAIDRGAFGDTVIGENTKIDNLVHIAHNCVIGRNCLIAAQTGFAGSVTVGDGVMFGGQAGVGDHIAIGDGANVAAGGGVLKDIPAGETWSGYPARPLRQFLRETVWLAKQASRKGTPKDD